MSILLILILAVAVIGGVCYLIFKTGGFLLDGLTSLINRIFTANFSEFSSSEIMVIILLMIAGIISLSMLRRIMRRY